VFVRDRISCLGFPPEMCRSAGHKNNLRRSILCIFLLSFSAKGIAFRHSRYLPASLIVARHKLIVGQRPSSKQSLTFSFLEKERFQSSGEQPRFLPISSHEMGRKSNLKLALRGGGSEAKSIQETDESTTIRRDLPSDVTCALTGKDTRAGPGNLEEEDLDGPQSDKGDVSEVAIPRRRW
jgi:hypothetical protein